VSPTDCDEEAGWGAVVDLDAACVSWGGAAGGKGPPRITAPGAVEPFPRCRRAEDAAPRDLDGRTCGLLEQESGNECSGQEQGALSLAGQRSGPAGSTGRRGFDGLARGTHGSTRLWWAPVGHVQHSRGNA